ncbi:hypothetical protein hairong_091 [Pseudomonas phage hairong]|nr:hypothetical protein hairong_091 [Pseudomonas phage hairong]
MKKLTSKVKVLEAKALRKLHKRQAADHARQAAKFRYDSMKLGCELAMAGENIYKNNHPVYDELILPLLNQAVQIANKYGFNTVFQTQTPVPEMPNFTHMLGAADSRTISPTLQGCLDFINSRPEAKIDKNGKPMVTGEEKPFANAIAIERMAQLLYESWAEERGYVAWVPGGNSTKQDEARMAVRRELARTVPAEKSDTDAT